MSDIKKYMYDCSFFCQELVQTHPPIGDNELLDDGSSGVKVYWSSTFRPLQAFIRTNTLHTCKILAYNSFKVTEYHVGVCGFPSTSTSSSYCAVALPELKTTQYEASDTGKH